MEDIDKFKEGDIVRLKSGGQEMTISSVNKGTEARYDQIIVVYFDNSKGSMVREALRPHVIQLANAE